MVDPPSGNYSGVFCMVRQLRYQTEDNACRSAQPRADGTDVVCKETLRFRRRLTAWLGVVVLAINLFGWTLVPSTEGPSSSAESSIAELFSAVLSNQDICEHGGGKSRHGDSHDRMVCPACFPLGNAGHGALILAGADIPAPGAPVVARQERPDSRQARSAFHPFQYQARAPPSVA